jgi:hypothetical protein
MEGALQKRSGAMVDMGALSGEGGTDSHGSVDSGRAEHVSVDGRWVRLGYWDPQTR